MIKEDATYKEVKKKCYARPFSGHKFHKITDKLEQCSYCDGVRPIVSERMKKAKITSQMQDKLVKEYPEIVKFIIERKYYPPCLISDIVRDLSRLTLRL